MAGPGGDGDLRQLLKLHRTEIAMAVDDVFPLLHGLADHDVVPEHVFKETLSQTEREGSHRAFHALLTWLLGRDVAAVRDFWAVLFKDYNLERYTRLRPLHSTFPKEVDLGRQRRSRHLSPSPMAPVPHRPQGKRKAPEERDGARMAQPSPRHAASPGMETWSGWVQGRNVAGHLERVTQGDPSCNTPRAPDKSKDHEEAGECGHHTLTPPSEPPLPTGLQAAASEVPGTRGAAEGKHVLIRHGLEPSEYAGAGQPPASGAPLLRRAPAEGQGAVGTVLASLPGSTKVGSRAGDELYDPAAGEELGARSRSRSLKPAARPRAPQSSGGLRATPQGCLPAPTMHSQDPTPQQVFAGQVPREEASRRQWVTASPGATHSGSGSTPLPAPPWQENEDECAACGDGGELICCDGCPRAFHLACLVPPLPRVPSGTWQCGSCAVKPGQLREADKVAEQPPVIPGEEEHGAHMGRGDGSVCSRCFSRIPTTQHCPVPNGNPGGLLLCSSCVGAPETGSVGSTAITGDHAHQAAKAECGNPGSDAVLSRDELDALLGEVTYRSSAYGGHTCESQAPAQAVWLWCPWVSLPSLTAALWLRSGTWQCGSCAVKPGQLREADKVAEQPPVIPGEEEHGAHMGRGDGSVCSRCFSRIPTTQHCPVPNGNPGGLLLCSSCVGAPETGSVGSTAITGDHAHQAAKAECGNPGSDAVLSRDELDALLGEGAWDGILQWAFQSMARPLTDTHGLFV
eukprot:XP_027320371.1 LOW QUALITY PROTEIN: autoimmune regulator [Anas platyrhynchos]